jgi:hypothetical protein
VLAVSPGIVVLGFDGEIASLNPRAVAERATTLTAALAARYARRGDTGLAATESRRRPDGAARVRIQRGGFVDRASRGRSSCSRS